MAHAGVGVRAERGKGGRARERGRARGGTQVGNGGGKVKDSPKRAVVMKERTIVTVSIVGC